jgi:hypothetical protein
VSVAYAHLAKLGIHSHFKSSHSVYFSLLFSVISFSPGGSMTALLSLEGKKTDPAGWSPFIKQYIAESYAESPDQYSDECNALDQLRSQSVNIPSHPNVLARLQQ